MGRKKTRFEWLADEEEEAAAEASRPVREARGPNKARRKKIEQHVLKLIRLSKSKRRTMPIAEAALDALDELAKTPPTPARRRLVLRTMGLMRDVDLEALEAALAGDTEKNARIRLQERWRKRLLEGGDDALQAWMEAYPQSDRQQLRALTRQGRRDSDAGSRARRALFLMLGGVLEQAEESSEE